MNAPAPADAARISGSEALLRRFPDAVKLWETSYPVDAALAGGRVRQAEGFSLTGYLIDGRVVILQEFFGSRAGSWDVYCPASESPSIEETLEAISQPAACRAKRCSYFQHYLAYGPAELEHAGYHAAEKICAEWQQRATDYFDSHPNALQLPGGLKEAVEAAERRVRA